MAEKNGVHRPNRLKSVVTAGALLLVPALAVAYFGLQMPALSQAAGLDARAFAPNSAEQKAPVQRAAIAGEEPVEVQLNDWEFTDRRRSNR